MIFRKLSLAKTFILATAIYVAPCSLMAQSYPSKPIRIVVPFAAGGGADNAARLIGQGLATSLGQSIVIENKGGGGGSIGAAAVAQSAPDGYTMLYDATNFAVNSVLRKVPYDAEKDFIPITQAVVMPNIMVVADSSPFRTFEDFLKAAKLRPGELTYASYGPGSSAHMIGELLKKEAKIDIVHVPYKGGAPALADVMGGHVTTYFASTASGLTYVKGGKLRALVVTSNQRMKELPDVPTIAESGFPEFIVMEWNGFFVPKNTPPVIVEKLSTEIKKVIAQPAIFDGLRKLGLTPIGNTSTEFSAFLTGEIVRWRALIKTSAITVE